MPDVKYHVRLTAMAEGDVDSALAWFAEQSASTAGERWFAQLMAKITTLESNPLRCGVAAESEAIGHDIRELLFGHRHHRYRILFEIAGQTVRILRVWHGARDAISESDL